MPPKKKKGGVTGTAAASDPASAAADSHLQGEGLASANESSQPTATTAATPTVSALVAPSPDVSPASTSSPSPTSSSDVPPALPVLSESHPAFSEFTSRLSNICAESQEELRDEMKGYAGVIGTKNKIDVGSVRDMLKFHLGRLLEVGGELAALATKEQQQQQTENATSPNSATIPAPYTLPPSVLSSLSLVPASLRPSLWLALLGCHKKDTTLLDAFDPDAITTKQELHPSPLKPQGIDAEANSEADEKSSRFITPALRSNIHIDALRTRAGMGHSASLVQELETLLLFYCYSRSVEYKQGLNEILAPILMVLSSSTPASVSAPASPSSTLSITLPSNLSTGAPIPRGAIYNAFYALISKFLPSIFGDFEFENLRTLFKLFRLLLKYHAPALAIILEENQVGAEVYSMAWFLTLFGAQSNTDSLATLTLLWEMMFIEDDPFIGYFVGLALLRSQARWIATLDSKHLPMGLKKLQITSGNLLHLFRDARELRSRTPTAFRQALFEVSFGFGAKGRMGMMGTLATNNEATKNELPHHAHSTSNGGNTFLPASLVSSHLLESLTSYLDLLPVMSLPAAEIVSQAYSDLTDSSASSSSSASASAGDGESSSGSTMKYILFDVRPASEFHAGHLPCAIHLSPSLLGAPTLLETLVGDSKYGAMRGCHFVFVGSEMASFGEVCTKKSSSASASSAAAGHGLNLPSSRRPIPPPSPSTALRSLEIEARSGLKQEGGNNMFIIENLRVKNVDRGEAPVLGESASSTSKLADLQTVDIDSASSPMSVRSNSSSSSSGVLYRPGTPDAFSSPPAHESMHDSPSPSPSASSATPSYIVSNPLLDSSTASFVAFFLLHGFPHLSICDGGYPAVHALVAAQQAAYRAQRDSLARGVAATGLVKELENVELVDHNSKHCLVCSPPAPSESHHSHTHSNSSSSSSAAESEEKNAPAPLPVAVAVPLPVEPTIPKSKDVNDALKRLEHALALAKAKQDAASSLPGHSAVHHVAESPAAKSAGSKSPAATTKDTDTSSTDKDPSPTPVGASVASATPPGMESKTSSTFSRFSLGFKKFSSGVSEKLADKLATFKAEKAAADAIKAEKAEIARVEKVAADAIKAEKAEIARVEKEKSDAIKAAEKEKSDAARLIKEREEKERLAKEKEEATKLAKDQLDTSTDSSDKDLLHASSAADAHHTSSHRVSEAGKLLANRFLSALGIKRGKLKDDSLSLSAAPASEVNAAIDLNDWAHDGDNIALFHCHEISLLPVANTPNAAGSPTTPSAPASPSSPPAPPPTAAAGGKVKRTGLLLPRVLAVTAGYVIVFQPAKPPAKHDSLDSHDSSDASSSAAAAAAGAVPSTPSEPSFGLAYLKSKFRLIDLDKITSKKDKPSVLTFHWKSVEGQGEETAATATATVATPSIAVGPPSFYPSPASASSTSSDSEPPHTPSSSFLTSNDTPSSASSSSSSSVDGLPKRSRKGPTTMFLVERPKDCIGMVRAKFLLAKASAALAESNKRAWSAEQQQQQQNQHNHQQQREDEEDAVSIQLPKKAVSDEPQEAATDDPLVSDPSDSTAASSSSLAAAASSTSSPSDSLPSAAPLAVSPPPPPPPRIREPVSPPFIVSPIGGTASTSSANNPASPDMTDLLDL